MTVEETWVWWFPDISDILHNSNAVLQTNCFVCFLFSQWRLDWSKLLDPVTPHRVMTNHCRRTFWYLTAAVYKTVTVFFLSSTAAAAARLVLTFTGRCFLPFEFPAREMMRECVSEFTLARWPRLGPATCGTGLIASASLRRKTFPPRHECIRQSWNFWSEVQSGREFDYCWQWNVPCARKIMGKTSMKSNSGLKSGNVTADYPLVCTGWGFQIPG